MKTDLVSTISNKSTFFWESFEGMARDEPGSFDVVLVE